MQELIIAAEITNKPGGHGLRHIRLVCGLFAATMLGLMLAAGAADAKPKGSNCSVAQAVKGAKCVKKQEQDLLHGVKNPHYLACRTDGSVWCCRNTGGGNYSCQEIWLAGPWDDGSTPTPGNATNVPAPSGPYGEVPGTGTNAPATNGPSTGPAGGWESGIFSGGFLQKSR